MADHEMLRKRAMEELVVTERTYVKRVRELIENWLDPLMGNTKLMSAQDYTIMFPTDIRIIFNFHLKFLEDLEDRWKTFDNESTKIGDIFADFAPYMKMYQRYLNNHERASKTLIQLQKQTSFRQFDQETRPKCNNQPLPSLLILPIQRIPRYEIILKEIVKHTPRDHPDRWHLDEAWDQIKEISTTMNERMKEFEARQRVWEVESRFSGMESKGIDTLVAPARVFIRESDDATQGVRIYDKHGKDKSITLFLFNDCLIYGVSWRGPNDNDAAEDESDGYNTSHETLKFGNLLSFDNAFEVVAEMDDYKRHPTIKLYSAIESVYIGFKTRMAKDLWVKLITESSSEEGKKLKNILASMVLQEEKESGCSSGVLRAPLFTPDDFTDRCQKHDCGAKFSIIQRRHHCYFCGDLVCSKCSSKQLPSPWKHGQLVRVCKTCYNEYKDKAQDMVQKTAALNPMASQNVVLSPSGSPDPSGSIPARSLSVMSGYNVPPSLFQSGQGGSGGSSSVSMVGSSSGVSQRRLSKREASRRRRISQLQKRRSGEMDAAAIATIVAENPVDATDAKSSQDWVSVGAGSSSVEAPAALAAEPPTEVSLPSNMQKYDPNGSIASSHMLSSQESLGDIKIAGANGHVPDDSSGGESDENTSHVSDQMIGTMADSGSKEKANVAAVIADASRARLSESFVGANKSAEAVAAHRLQRTHRDAQTNVPIWLGAVGVAVVGFGIGFWVRNKGDTKPNAKNSK